MSDNVKKDPQGEPKGHQNDDGTVEYAREGDKPGEPDQTAGYQESQEHIPDPTSMSGTLETSGTGGGRHAHLAGISRAFGDVETFIGKVESLAHLKVSELVEGVTGLIREEEARVKVQPVTQQTTVKGGLSENDGDIVQSDGTGHPNPASEPVSTDQDQDKKEDAHEGSKESPTANQPTLDGDKSESVTGSNTPGRRGPVKKTTAPKNAPKK